MPDRERRCRMVAGAVASLLCASASSQTPGVSDAHLERTRRLSPQITAQDMDRARQQHRMPTDDELARVPVPAAPRLDSLPAPAARQGADLGAIAEGFEAIDPAAPAAAWMASGPSLLVFVSFSLPEATLVRLVEQAAAARASLVLRGLVNGSLKQTIARAQALIGRREVAFQIDPLSFDRFGVSQAPTFVLLRAGASPTSCAAGSCFAADSYAMVAGDVSLPYALDFIARSAPSFATDAAVIARRLK